jgi:hypothetical protein
MIAALLVGALLAYFGFALSIAIFVHRQTDQLLIPIFLFAVMMVLPVHEFVFGFSEFEKIDATHPGTPVPRAPIYVDGFLVEGRTANSPSEALRTDQGNYLFKEFPRDAVKAMKPAPKEPLDAYVQFFRTSLNDPACTQRLTQNPSSAGCVGVTSSPAPRSRYALFEEPDSRKGNAEQQLNGSRLFPIVGLHSRVSDVRAGTTIAEIWQFRMPSKLFRPFAWYSKQNPSGFVHAALALRPNTSWSANAAWSKNVEGR